MYSVRDILSQKGGTVWSVAPDDTVLEAIKQMAQRGVGALLVMDGDRLAGLISERDYSRKIILQGRRSQDTPVRAVMSHPVLTVTPDTTVQEGMALMTEKFVRHLPVVENERVVGVVSIGDLVKAVIEDQQALIEQLERYVTG